MKLFFSLALSLVIVLFTSVPAFAQAAPKPNAELPDKIKKAAGPLLANYPKVEAKKTVKAPADSVWIFRANSAAAGTVEAGFQGAKIVYLIFRRGTGGTGWKMDEISQIHQSYHKNLLKEKYSGQKYRHSVSTAISAGVITRKDFDAKALDSAF